MKLSCIYWTLLLISVVSSCLLFIIVASESTNGPLKKHETQRNEVISNVTIRELSGDSGSGINDALNVFNEKTEKITEFSKNENSRKIPDSSKSPESKIHQKFTENAEGVVDIVKEGLTQQPNLSQGISETGQAVVLTLVDTASVELQNLAEPHLSSEIRPKPSKNLTAPRPGDPETTITLSSPGPSRLAVPTVLLPTEELNATEPSVPENSEETVTPNAAETEQKPLEDLPPPGPPPIKDDPPENPDASKEEGLVSSGEFDEAATKIKLASGGSDETASIVLDGLVGSGASEPHEDIPSFSEWAQKRLEEAEKKKTHPNASIQNPGGPGRGVGSMKVRSKNYASPDCGAKIVAVNPEARSARSVLVSTRDEYMLNTCTSRVWFVVELCEAIQAKKIELANFELFSSSPKDFSVFVSDRFPTRDWSPVGQFTAQDERDIQSFALHPHLFGKFIKVDLHSHYGSEHFCPISLFRAYGTSEFEVLETETEVQETVDSDDEDDDEEVQDNDSESSRNLFGSARDAVIRIVQKAAEVLVKTGDLAQNNITKIQESIEDNIKSSFASCMTPRYTILCNNCTDDRFASVFQLLSCRVHHLDSILKISFVNHTLRHGELCSSYGVDVMRSSKKRVDRKNTSSRNLQSTFLASVFSPEYVVALCNVLATKERKLVLNSSSDDAVNTNTTNVNVSSAQTDTETNNNALPQITATCLPDSNSDNCRTLTATKRRSDPLIKEDLTKDPKTLSTVEIATTPEILASQIKPTKTLAKEDPKRDTSVPILEPSKDAVEETVHAESVTTPSSLITTITFASKAPEEDPGLTTMDVTPQTVYSQSASLDSQETVTVDVPKVEAEKIEEKEERKERESEEMKLTQDQLSFDTLLSDLKDLESDASILGSASNPSTVSHPATASSTPQQKESVFLRLSNRIKALERNMSLSGQYLEELSRRYKKQVEEMQRSLERATATMGEEFKKGEERESKRLEEISALREEISSLSESVEMLLYDQNSWRSKLSTFGQHILFIFVELVILVLIISYCRRSSDLDEEVPSKVPLNKELTRRKSAESMTTAKTTKQRRPSEIASKIAGSYRELMIDERSELRKERKKKRKRDSAMRLTTSFDSRREALRMLLPSRSLSIDCGNYGHGDHQRLEAAPEPCESQEKVERQINGVTQRIVVEEIDGPNQWNYISEVLDPLADVKNDQEHSRLNIFKNRLHSPSFMKTALRSRSFRNVKNEANSLKTDNWEWYSRNSGSSRSDQDSPLGTNPYVDVSRSSSQNGSAANGHHGASDDSGSGSPTPTSGKKRKDGGLRKIMKKFF